MNKMLLLMLVLAIGTGIATYIGYYFPTNTTPIDLLANGTAAVLDSSTDQITKITNTLNH